MERLLFEWATFSEPLLFKGPYLYSFARATFSKNPANFQQLTSWSFQILKVPREVHRVMHYSENLSIKYHDQNFYIKTAFSGKHWTGQTIDECEKVSFWGNLIKTSISVLRLSTELAENQQFKTRYSSLQYILLKMTINLPLKWKISTRVVTLFWDLFWRQV